MQKFTPTEYLKIDIASNFGLEKELWEDRLSWFDQNESTLENMVKEAEEPALFYAGVNAYRTAMQGKAIAYPVGLDATASGAQLLALLIGCEKSAKLCNVINTGKREDFYTRIYEFMCGRTGAVAKIDRDDIKDAVMPSFYGSEASPKRVFGEGDLLDTFFETMEEEAPGLWALNQALLGLWQPENMSHDWIMPDNFHVHVKVMDNEYTDIHFLERPYEVVSKVNRPMQEGRSIGANTIHSLDGMVVREVLRRCYWKADTIEMQLLCHAGFHSDSKPDDNTPNAKMVITLAKHYERTGFLSARILDHIDENSVQFAPKQAVWDLIQTLPANPFPVLTVHDRFSVHPNYANDLRAQYNQILSELAASTLLSDIASQIVGEEVEVEKLTDFSKEVLDAEYALS